MEHRMFIAGEWVDGESGERMDATSPATGESLGSVPAGSREDAQRAIKAANAAWRGWAARSAFERAEAMERIAAVVAGRRDDLARTLTLDQGKPLKAEAYDEVDELEQYWLMAAADARRLEGTMPPSVSADKRVLVYRVPKGVVGVITPWNWPYTMPAEVIAPALAAGNAVVWVPAPTTSVAGVKLAECIAEAELPAGVFNFVTGQGAVVGDEIAGSTDTHAVGFVGSITTGYKVAERAAGKSLLLEMGGNGPVVVLEDADLDKAVAATLVASFLCAGQSCTAGERFLVHESVHDAYLDKLAAAMAKEIRLGDPFADETTMGPLNNEPVAEKMDRHIGEAVERGAEVVSGGNRASGYPTGLYYEPTVLAGVTHEMKVSTEETFGPIVPIATIRDEEEALALIDASPYGLLASVFTQDLRRGMRFAEAARAGWVNVNESSNYWESHLPFGGRAGSRSGIGRVGGRHPFETFTETKTVIVEL
ncbi:MAG TPA: aldehyde dehydrogenase family protein [Gaiellaceae bacterium]|nr:aldehyde dehydrogenase family protein [Gaiellaceae bacterium]